MLRHEVDFKSIFLRVLEVQRGSGRQQKWSGKGVGTRGWVTGRGYMWTRGCSLLPHFPQSSSAFNLLFLWATFDYLPQGFGPIDSSRWHKPGMWAGLRWWVMVVGAELEANRRTMLLLCSCQPLSSSIADPGLPDLFLFFEMKPEIQISLWDLSTCSCYN